MKNKRKRNFVVDDDESYSENSDVYFEEEVDFELERELRESRENMKSVLQKSLQSTSTKEKEFSEPMESAELLSLTSPSKFTSIIITASKSPPSPLAHKEYKRRKLTEFLFESPFHHPSPSLYHYPYVSAVVITSSVNSITSSSNSTFSKPAIGLLKNKKLKKSASWIEQSEEQVEETDGIDGETKEESTNVSRIMEAIRSLGGKATGNDISSWICKQYSNDITMKKRLSYTVNAVLSSKKHSGLFTKEMVYFDGHKRALWSLSASSLTAELASQDIGEKESTPVKEKNRTKRSELESFISGTPFQIPTDEEPETDVGEEIYTGEEKNLKEEKSFGELPIKEETSSQSIRDSKIGRAVHHSDPLSSRAENLETQSRGESKAEELEANKDDNMEEDDVYVNMAAFSGEIAEENSNETSNNEPKEEARDATQNKRQSDGSASVDEKTDAADNSNGSQPNEESESSAERIIDDEEISDIHENGIEDEKDNSDAEGRQSDDNNSGEEMDGRKDDDKNSEKPSYSSRRKDKLKFDEDLIEEIELDEKDASTYTEMIEQALRALGGRGTGLDITTYIDEHYRSVLKNKTDTWRNSVMGCLSANRRNLFSKEPVKEHAKRYVWKLNDPAFAVESPKSSVLSKRRKKADSAPETPQTPVSGTEDKILKRKNTNSPEKIGKEEKPKSRSESPIDSPVSNSPPPTPFIDDGSGNGNFLQLIMEALKSMGGKATGNDITDWIAQNYKEHGSNKKKLTYTVNAILSSKKYAGIFSKDQMINNGQRALWKLSQPNGNSKGRGKKS